MGLKTLDDFRTDLQLALGNRGFSEPELDNWINTGLGDLGSQHEFEELDSEFSETILANTNSVVPAAVEGITDLQNVTDKLFMTSVGEARWNQLDPTETGQPQYYFRRADTIFVWPTPIVDTALLGEKLATHPLLTDPTDVTELQSMWDRAIHLLAMFHSLTDLEEPNRALYFANVSSRYIAQRIDLSKVDGEATGMPVQPIDSYAELVRQRQNSRTIISG